MHCEKPSANQDRRIIERAGRWFLDLRMEPRAPWYYWNNLPEVIPVNVEAMSTHEMEKFLALWKQTITTENVQNDVQRLNNIRDLTRISFKVPQWLMDRTKETASLYVEGCWLASIALCGSIGEYVSWYLLESGIASLGITVLIGFRRSLGWQSERINLLLKKKLITEWQAELLTSIAETRNDFLHVEKLGPSHEVKANALNVLRKLIDLLNDLFPVDETFRVPT